MVIGGDAKCRSHDAGIQDTVQIRKKRVHGPLILINYTPIPIQSTHQCPSRPPNILIRVSLE